MTGTIDIRLHAEHPDEPLKTVYVFAGSQLAPRIVNAPTKVGSWEIESVSIVYTWPDGTSAGANMTKSDDVWIATVPSSETAGKVRGGFQVTADGTDENGNSFSNLCLGVGDLEVLPRDLQLQLSIDYFRILSEVPQTPARGDATEIDGVLKWYDGTAWKALGGDPVAIDTTLSHAGQAAEAKATGDALKGKADEFTDFTPNDAPDYIRFIGQPLWYGDCWSWNCTVYDEDRMYVDTTHGADEDAKELTLVASGLPTITASRNRVLRTNDISADNESFSAAVEEVIRRLNNAQ